MATEMMSSSAAAADAAAAASTQKMSRYRSVRRAQEQQQTRQPTHASQHDQPSHPNPRMPAVPDSPPQNEAPLSRSMSRYHRRPVTSHATSPQPPLQRFNPESDDSEPPLPQSPPSASRYRNPGSPYQSTHAANTAQRRPRSSNNRGEASPPASDAPRQLSLRSDDSAREILEKEKERQRQLREKYEAEARAKRQARQAELDRAEKQRQEEEEAARLRQQREAQEAEALRRQREEQKTEHERGRRLQKAEPRKVSQQKEERQRRAPSAKPEDRAPKAPLTSPTVSPPRQQDVGVGMFKRRKDDVLGLDAPVQFSAAPQLSLNFDSHADETIRPGGGGVVRNIDAPTSAVNAGDRRVTVVCNKKRILLPVTPTTTPLDLIKSASTVLTDPIDIRTAVISEYFTKVSITRPLRNYEYVRDVMNSWDHDNQNELTIIDSDVDGINQDDLLAYKVPEARPEGMSCYIQYSSRPGKWSKRLLTLRPDGQLVMAKNEKTKEKDLENILTLTDYDIYTVTQQKLAKVRPPKKICYAVKSMQKSNIFADESQYVHFFCTNDRNTANLFYSSLQTWRSWYLKHQKGEGQKKKSPAQRNIAAEAQPTSGHSRGESVGSHYQLGAFSSLLDMDSFNKKLDEIEVHRPGEFPDDKPLSKLDSRAINTRKKSVRTKNPPPTAMGRSASCKPSGSQPMSRQTSAQRSSDGKDDEEFASGGLLGRVYTERQAAVQAREQQAAIQAREPFMDGPSLLNNIGRLGPPMNDSGVKRSTSVRSNHHRRTSSDLQRSASKRVPGMPEPLVDLTPTYRPPPQHLNKGKGFNPGAGAGPLVESATSIEEAIKIPSLYRPPPQHLNKGKGYNPGTGAGPLVESATSIEEAIKIPSTYRPPPQHLNKGKGFNPGAGAGPLVESATSIEEAIKVPSSTDWRAGRPGTSRAAGIDRTRSLKGRGEPLAAHTKNNHGGIPEDASKAFTGGGLVSQAGYSLGKDNVGRGVMDFSKAKGPMVNLATNGEFAQGSLLSGLPVTPPIIDRSGED